MGVELQAKREHSGYRRPLPHGKAQSFWLCADHGEEKEMEKKTCVLASLQAEIPGSLHAVPTFQLARGFMRSPGASKPLPRPQSEGAPVLSEKPSIRPVTKSKIATTRVEGVI